MMNFGCKIRAYCESGWQLLSIWNSLESDPKPRPAGVPRREAHREEGVLPVLGEEAEVEGEVEVCGQRGGRIASALLVSTQPRGIRRATPAAAATDRGDVQSAPDMALLRKPAWRASSRDMRVNTSATVGLMLFRRRPSSL